MRNLIEISSKVFSHLDANIKHDTLINSISQVLKCADDYKQAEEIINHTKPTPFAIQLLIPCLLLVICLKENSVISDFSEIENIKALQSLLKCCLGKGYNFHSHEASLALRFTHVGLLLYQSIGIDITKGIGPSKESVFHIGTLAPHLHNQYFSLGIKLNVDPNQKQQLVGGCWDNTPLHNIIANEAFEMLVEFVSICVGAKKRLDLTIRDKEGKDVMLLAAKMKDIKTLDFLVRSCQKNPNLFRVDFSTTDNHMRNGLHYACLYKEANIIQLFLNNGANTQLMDRYKKRPVDYLVLKNKAVLSQSFNEVCIDPDRKPQGSQNVFSIFSSQAESKTLIQTCLSDSCFAEASILALSQGLLKNKKDRELVFRNLVSKQSDQIETLNSFLQAKVDINASGASGNTALHVAAKFGNMTHVEWLLDNKATYQFNAKQQGPDELAPNDTIRKLIRQRCDCHTGSVQQTAPQIKTM